MTSVIVRSRGERKEGKNRWIQKETRIYRGSYYVTQCILSQTKNKKNVCKRKNTPRIFCQNL